MRYYEDFEVGEVTEVERTTRRFAMVRLGGLVGKDGLEREYDDSLRGADGLRFVEVSALGHVVREAGAAPTLRLPYVVKAPREGSSVGVWPRGCRSKQARRWR